ncbi:MAG: acyloxyacyl hydrolase [Sedimentisphaerales bacterium]|nr:acyloxyacyl hydrolase [Sedimentisphaerales bacterium]
MYRKDNPNQLKYENYYRYIKYLKAIIAVYFCVFSCTETYGKTKTIFDDFYEGNLRIETTIAAGLSYEDHSDRKGDYYFADSIEYEWPVYKPMSMGIRYYPKFIYLQSEHEKGQSDTVYAQACGFVFRFYPNKNFKGLFNEIGSSLMWNESLYNYNASHINILTEIGIGYKFDSKLHLSLKIQHISNANMKSPNYGINGLALSLGFTF